MTTNTKKIIEKKIKLKNLLQRNQDKLIKLIYPKKKNTSIDIQNWKIQFQAICTKTFRKKWKNESDSEYLNKKYTFAYKKRKLLTNSVMSLTQIPKFLSFSKLLKTKQKKLNRIVKHSHYWHTKPRNSIPSYEVTLLRKYKRRKLDISHSFYINSIKRWTNLSEQRAKIFMDKMSDHENTSFLGVDYFTTYKEAFGYKHANGKFFDEHQQTLHLNVNVKNKYKKLKKLKRALLSKLPTIAFKPANKYTKKYAKLTSKQIWLSNRYIWLKYKQAKKKGFGIDFLKTFLGQQFLLAHEWHKDVAINPARIANRPLKRFLFFNNEISTPDKFARQFQATQKRAWYYTNFVFPKRLPYYFQKNSVTNVYPYNKFLSKWFQHTAVSWVQPLISTRILYSGFLTKERREHKWLKKFSWIPYLRNKFKIKEKKNKLYIQRQRLICDKTSSEYIRTREKARIKQLVAKTTLPFYGHLCLKQFARIRQKAQIKKSINLSRDEIQLGYLERRLDVIVYRLNLAPNILWARKLIQDGSIYVSASKQATTKEFEKMYANYKQHTYPLKLRDPQTLYKKSDLTGHYLVKKGVNKRIPTAHFKFLLEPLRNINYLTQPGDVILCAPGSLQNQYKTNKIFWQKPIPTHLLTCSQITNSKTQFKPRSNDLISISNKNQESSAVGLVLFNPTFEDLHKSDRMQRAFMRWLAL